MSRAKKARRKWRKEWRAAITILYRNFYAVGRHFGGAIFRETPAEMAVSVEVMLFELYDELEEWPDAWEHVHRWGAAVDAVCSCGECRHGKRFEAWPILRRNGLMPSSKCVDCAKARERQRMREDAAAMLQHVGFTGDAADLAAVGLADILSADDVAPALGGIVPLEMGPPQDDDP